MSAGKKPTIGDYVRTGSCLGEPQANALECIKSKNITLFSDIVSDITEEDEKAYPLPLDHWINRPLEEEDDKTLLMAAIDDGLHEFIEVLLQAGADAKAFNPELGKCPVHFASATGDLRSLQLLFANKKNRADPNALVKNSGRTAMHICTENGKVGALEYLLTLPDVEVDVKDKKGGGTALYLAAKKGNRLMSEMLIKAGSDVTITCFNKTVEEHIKEEIPGLDPSTIRKTRAPLANSTGSFGKLAEASSTFERLLEIVDNSGVSGEVSSEDLDEFKSILLEVDSAVLNRALPGGYTLLQRSSDEGLFELVEVLLKEGEADPNGTTDTADIPPALMAANRGNGAILELLFESGADFTLCTGDSRETVLHCLLKHGSDDRGRYERALDLVLAKEELLPQIAKIVNKRDALKNTALHYATQMWSQETVRKLLEAGANIGMKNHFDEVPISKILPDTMEDFLDEFCLDATRDVHHEDFEITFNYSFLAPPREDLPVHAQLQSAAAVSPYAVANDVENQRLNSRGSDSAEKVALPETQSLWYMAQSKEHRHLLKHPVVTSFLHMKWDRIRRHFNFNLRFYSLFVFLLTWYSFEEFGSQDLKPEGGGPITFWYALYIIFTVVLLLFIMKDFVLDLKDLQKAEMIKKDDLDLKHVCFAILSNWLEVLLATFLIGILIGGVPLLWYALLAMLGVLTARELLQLAVSVKRYLLSPENLIEVSVMVLLAIILFAKDDIIEHDLKRIFAAYAIVLSWAELIVLVGKHPKLSRLNVYATMFFKVLGSFTLFLCWYAPFILAFGIGFYIMLHSPDAGFFSSPWLALVKTSTMFVGELEFADLPIQQDALHGIPGYLFLLFFVFIIVVVLMNLLNGLAVSDTGVIQEKAEIFSYVSRVDTISYMESILLGDPFNFLSNWPALKVLADVPSCSLCARIYKNEWAQKLFHRVTGATGILLFYNYLPNKRLTFKPNLYKYDCLRVKITDEATISAAKTIVLKRRAREVKNAAEKDKTRAFDSRLQRVEERLDEILKLLKNPVTSPTKIYPTI